MAFSAKLQAVVLVIAACNLSSAEEPLLFRCAPNAMYVYLAAHGADAKLDQIDAALDHEIRPVSVLEVIRIADDFGVKSVARRFRREQTREIPFPAIAFIPPNEPGQPGHFVVLLSSDENFVTFVDGTTGQLRRWHHQTLWNQWQNTGIAIVKDSRRSSALETALVVVSSLLSVFFLARNWKHNPAGPPV